MLNQIENTETSETTELRETSETTETTEPEREWPVTISLKHPIDFGSTRIEALTFRRGRAGDIKGMKLSGEVPAEQLITIASRMSAQPTQVIERLDMDDAGEVMAIAMDFYGRCLAGGRRRSR